MKTQADVLALPISQLGLSRGTLRWAHRLLTASNQAKLPDDLTPLQEVLTAYAAKEQSDHRRPSFYRKKLPSEAAFLKRLAELGLTRFDFLYLPQETVTLKMQKSISKEDWLDKPVLLLGTMPQGTILHFARGREQAHEVTVRRLLDETDTLLGSKMRQFKASVQKTRALLGKLGFTYVDGGIMRLGTLKEHAEKLAAKHSLKLATATKVVRIAAQEGWLHVSK